LTTSKSAPRLGAVLVIPKVVTLGSDFNDLVTIPSDTWETELYRFRCAILPKLVLKNKPSCDIRTHAFLSRRISSGNGPL